MAFIIKISYGVNPKNKGEITQMKNGPFIYKTDIRPTRLFCLNITSMETLVVLKMSTVLLIIPPPLSLALALLSLDFV